MNQKSNIAILNFWWASNYGANLTAYALQQLIENSILVDNSDFQQYLGDSIQKFHHNFAKKYLKTSNVCRTIFQLQNLNKNCECFIVGSDQVFRQCLNKRIADTFLLDFADTNAKKIAFSASFGVNKEKFLKENSQQAIEKMKQALKSFDYISVREKSGVEICKDILGVEAEWIIDPVFILDKSKYDELILNSERDFSRKIVSCIFEKHNKKLDNYLEKKYKKNIVELWHSNLSVEDWLNAIKNCEFLVTNSYHAMCFAIIFNKPFICISNKSRGAARFESIVEMLGIENQCVNSIDEIYEKDCVFNVDWNVVNRRIEEERQRGLEFLQKALDAPCEKFEEKQAVRTKYLEERVSELEAQANFKYQIKKELWNLWLVIFHKYLPEFVKNLIRKLRGKN